MSFDYFNIQEKDTGKGKGRNQTNPMKIVIEKRFSTDTLIEGEANSLREFVVKNKSDLRGSDLRGSDLSGSDLSYTKIKARQKDELLKALRIEIID